MVKVSRNNLSPALQAELDRLATLGDLIGGCDTFEHLPTTNDVISGAGLTFIASLTEIDDHDLVMVADASGDSHGINAIYEASTTTTGGAAVTWTFVYNMNVPVVNVPVRTSVLSSDIATAVATPPAVAVAVKNAWTANPLSVEVYVNGLNEPDFTIDTNSKLQLTGYTADGWTIDDSLEVYAWL
jgi:hypothetical protein